MGADSKDSIIHEGHPPDLAPLIEAWQRHRQAI